MPVVAGARCACDDGRRCGLRAVPRACAGLETGDGGSAESADSAAVDFFEKNVRPILATRCHGCHGPTKQKGGLRLDARPAILSGGSTGPAIVPGNPGESLLVDAINYGGPVQMPPKSKLPPAEIATLTEWVKRGAPWGVDLSPKTNGVSAPTDAPRPGQLTPEEYARRAQFWCFRPIRRISPPEVKGGIAVWTRNPIDRFIQAAHSAQGLTAAPEADKRTLIRRLTFDLLGLPPMPADVAAFLADDSPDAYERLVERLLASPHYGERWARHWLDLVRYAETAGHEFDYDIPNAYRYRDYVIRAICADLPYNQLVVEHIAGDLLENPRRHIADGFNESILGTGFYFLGEGTHSPVDVREDQMRRIDNQIDVISKTFLGLTVACARCHDHKFDAIRTNDYYALAGFLASSRYQQAFIDAPERAQSSLTRMRAVRAKIVETLRAAQASLPQPIAKQLAVLTATCREGSSHEKAKPASVHSATNEVVFEDFERDHYDGWSVTGNAFGDGPSRQGDVRLELLPSAVRLVAVKPGVAHSGLLSDCAAGVLRSRTFTIEQRYILCRVAGQNGRLSVVVDGYEKIRDPIYGGLTTRINQEQLGWIAIDAGMWQGHSAYLEIADGAAVDFGGATTVLDDGRGYIAVDEIRFSSRTEPSPAASNSPFASATVDLTAVVAALGKPQPDLARQLAADLDLIRTLDARVPKPTLALAVADGTGVNEHVHVRGSHLSLGEVVPRRFLQVLGGSETSTGAVGSGRLELAERMVDPALTRSCRACWSTGSGSIISVKGSSSRPTTSAPWGALPRIPSCSTGWRPSSLIDGGRSRRCTG